MRQWPQWTFSVRVMRSTVLLPRALRSMIHLVGEAVHRAASSRFAVYRSCDTLRHRSLRIMWLRMPDGPVATAFLTGHSLCEGFPRLLLVHNVTQNA